MASSRQFFDPRALLDPHGSAKSAKSAKGEMKNTDETPDRGVGSYMEKMYNIQYRDARPAKRVKREHQPKQDGDGDGDEDDEEDEDLVEVKKKAQALEIRGTGGFAAYVKEQRDKLNENEQNLIVDLTNDGDAYEPNESEEELIVTKDDTMMEVCLGRIESARVMAHHVPTPKTTSFINIKQWPAMAVGLQRRPGPTKIIAVRDPQQKDFGNLDPRVAGALCPLMDGAYSNGLRLQARLETRPKKPWEHSAMATSDSYGLAINVYAPRKYVKGIGQWLSQQQVFLRDPLVVDRGVEVVNPHKPKDYTPQRRSVLASTTTRGGAVIAARTVEQTRQEVYKIFDAIAESTDLPEVATPSSVLTELLPHQKQALYFLRKRERLPLAIVDKDNLIVDDDEEEATTKNVDDHDSLWQKQVKADGRIKWRNAITGHEVRQQPEPLLGGVLADVMGLGKTLNILCLIVGSLGEAQAFGRQEPSEDLESAVWIQSRATLLVCPLSTIVNWEEQIKAHLKKTTIKYALYQGPNRTNEPEELAKKYDLVITTYQMVANEYSRDYRNRPNKPLFETNWFRVVLDEAHQIRNTSSNQSKAATEISAQRRWCMTGTPVQNRLEDLGALIKFLKISPFDEPGVFSQFISSPLRSGDPEAIPKLRVLVDTITLRRLKDKLDLPNRDELIVELEMSEAERSLYNQFQRDTTTKVQAMAGNKQSLGGKSYAQVLKAIGRLRMLCAHSGDMLSDEDWEMAKGFDAANAIDLEDDDLERPDRTVGQAFEMYRLLKEANVAVCAQCAVPVEPTEIEELDDGEDEVFGHLTPCNQLFCNKHIGDWKTQMKPLAGSDNYGKCYICESYIRVTSVQLSTRAFNTDTELQNVVLASKFARNLSRYTEPHTKTKTLLECLAHDRVWSEDNPDERPIKSVVFSEWTTHLDLIQLAFTNAKVPYTRLDGSMRFSQRTNALTTFGESRDINVILVSLKAGGLGLNLTAASRVYVMEPNYNPAAEQQAIERVHRLGQKRDVVIKRFIMYNSIEEKVLDLQRRKIELATFSVDRENVTKGNETDRKARMKKTLEDLKELLR